ncbi:MAG: hypothetical protein IJM23_00825 [Lachnospiraceae bacterium]|nr:hypothetical protein [Lachnospiraceae bacterium]
MDRIIYLIRDSFGMADDVSAPHICRFTWRDTDWCPEVEIFNIIEAYLGPNLPGYYWRGYSDGKMIADVILRRENMAFKREIKLVDNWQELLRKSRIIYFHHGGCDNTESLPITIEDYNYTCEDMEKWCKNGYAADRNYEKQREIGKQLFLVNILHHENDKVANGGYSTLSRERIAAWASMTKDEIDDFIDACSVLDPHNISSEVAERYCDEYAYEDERYCFVKFTCYSNGITFAVLIDIDKFEHCCKGISKYNYQKYSEKFKEYPIDESYATPEVFGAIMRFYIQILLETIRDVLFDGYDWDVVTNMTRIGITEERYHDLVNSFLTETETDSVYLDE